MNESAEDRAPDRKAMTRRVSELGPGRDNSPHHAILLGPFLIAIRHNSSPKMCTTMRMQSWRTSLMGSRSELIEVCFFGHITTSNH
jgi:hypothetical protein